MNQTEALNTIESMRLVLHSQNKLSISSAQHTVIGICFMAIPIIEFFLGYTNLNSYLFENFGRWGHALPRMFGYGIGFYLLGRFFEPKEKSILNPLISKVMTIDKYLIACCFAVGIGLSFVGQTLSIYPVVFLLIGMVYFVQGQYSNDSFIWVAWFYILLAPIYWYLTSLGFKNHWQIFIMIQGLSLIFIGLYSKNKQGK